MKLNFPAVALFLSSLFNLGAAFNPAPVPGKKVIIGYVAGFRGLMGVDSIHAEKLTHINYAFATIQNNRVYLPKIASDTINLRNLHNLLLKNPSLKILVSIGGWSGSRNFSDAAFSDTSRRAFASSAVELVKQFGLDGIDIDWEYPGMEGAGNIYHEEDKQNFTLMLKALREGLNDLSSVENKPLLLTIAAGADTSFLVHTEMGKLQQYLDYINLMTYDFKTEEDSVTGHHTNLYISGKNNDGSSTDHSVTNYINAGVPASKIVAGVAFYARAWKVTTPASHGLYTKVRKGIRGMGYTKLKDSVLSQNDYTKYWDKEAHAPYLFNAEDSIFISYDDERSIREKCIYTQEKNLAGIMFWEYFADYKCYLLDVIDKQFKY